MFEIEPTPIAYNVKSSDQNLFTNTELNSIQLRDICDTYGIPREAQRELVYLMRTIIKNNEESRKTDGLGMYLFK